jgi:hypothetical protein
MATNITIDESVTTVNISGITETTPSSTIITLSNDQGLQGNPGIIEQATQPDSTNVLWLDTSEDGVLPYTIVNVKSYGALGDGVTDDTVAIQTALDDAAEGQTVFLPHGQYRISAPLVLPINVGLEGEHSTPWDYSTNESSAPTSLKLLPTFSGSAAIMLKDEDTLGGGAEQQGGQTIKNLSLDGNRYGHDIKPTDGVNTSTDTVPDAVEDTVKIKSISATVISTYVAKLTLTADNNFAAGDIVTLYGIQPIGYNNTYTVEATDLSSTQFSVLARNYGTTVSVDNDGRTSNVTFTGSNPNSYQIQTTTSFVGTVNLGDKISGTGIPDGATITLMDTINNLLNISPTTLGTVSGTVTVTPVPTWAVAKRNAIHGIYARGNLESVRLENVTVSWFTGDGVRIEPYWSSNTKINFCLGWRFFQVMCHGNKGNGFSIITLTDSTFTDCLAGANRIDGFYLSSPANGIYNGCRSEFNFGSGMQITGALGAPCTIIGFSTDGNYSHGLYLNSISDTRPLNITGTNLGRDGLNVNNTDPKAGLRIKRGAAPINISGIVASVDYSTDSGVNSHNASPAYGLRVSGTTTNLVHVNSSILVGSTNGYTNDNSSNLVNFGSAVKLASTGGVESITPGTYSNASVAEGLDVELSSVYDQAFAAGAPNTWAGIIIDGTGKIQWGSGSATWDTNLYRFYAGGLKTDGDLTVANALYPRTVVASGYSPIAKTASFAPQVFETNFVVTGTASVTVTLPTATAGRTINILNKAAFTIVSASSNVYPRTSGTLGTAICPATVGSWATLVADGTNWQIMAGA